MELALNRVPWRNCAAGMLTFVLNYQIPVRVSCFFSAVCLIIAFSCDMTARHGIIGFRLDVRGSMHHNTNPIEITNKMRSCSRIYYSNVS